MTENRVFLADGVEIPSRTLVWTAGTAPNPLTVSLPCANERGRVRVNEFLRVPGCPNVWAVGDCAFVPDIRNPGKPHPPTAQHAMRQGKVVARNIAAVLLGRRPQPFSFRTIGLLASIGRRTGVARIFGFNFSGFFAWWMWSCPGWTRRFVWHLIGHWIFSSQKTFAQYTTSIAVAISMVRTTREMRSGIMAITKQPRAHLERV